MLDKTGNFFQTRTLDIQNSTFYLQNRPFTFTIFIFFVLILVNFSTNPIISTPELNITILLNFSTNPNISTP